MRNPRAKIVRVFAHSQARVCAVLAWFGEDACLRNAFDNTPGSRSAPFPPNTIRPKVKRGRHYRRAIAQPVMSFLSKAELVDEVFKAECTTPGIHLRLRSTRPINGHIPSLASRTSPA